VASKDAELVCSHNLDLETETDGKGYFKSKSLSELVKIKTGVFTHKKKLKNLSSLKEVLEKVPKSIFLNIEIKTGSIFKRPLSFSTACAHTFENTIKIQDMSPRALESVVSLLRPFVL
jgi:glycerophosphoryl diester phosphodiesterase